MDNRIRYTLDDVVKNHFYQMPKFLLSNEFKGMNNDARVLYSILKDRHELSVKNKWTNENNEVYIIFSREELCELMGLSKPTVIKAMNNLKKYNLIEQERVGLGQANKIYLLTVEMLQTPINPQKSKSFTSESEDFLPSEFKDVNFLPYINNTYGNDNKSSQRQTGNAETNETKQDFSPVIDNDVDNDNIIQNTDNSENEATSASIPTNNDNTTAIKYTYDSAKKLIHKNIEYDFYKQHRNTDIDLIDELVDCALDVILTKSDTVKIGGEDKDRQLIIRQYLKLNSTDIDLVLDKYREQRHKITHIHSYLKTMLYTVKQENGHYYTNAVRADNPYLF